MTLPSLSKLIGKALDVNATELILATGASAVVRIDGEFQYVDVATFASANDIINSLHELPSAVVARVSKGEPVSLLWTSGTRPKVHVRALTDSQGGLTVICKLIPYDWGIQEEVADWIAPRTSGLWVIGGQPRSGRSLAMAACVRRLSREISGRILVCHDGTHPLHRHASSIVLNFVCDGEEVVRKTFESAGPVSLDVVAFDGLYGTETFATALDACRRGSIVLVTAYGRNTIETLRNIIAAFPAGEQGAVRAEMGRWLQGVMAQTLITSPRTRRRMAVIETLAGTDDIREMLTAARFDNLAKILSSDDPRSPHRSFETAIRNLRRKRLIGIEGENLLKWLG